MSSKNKKGKKKPKSLNEVSKSKENLASKKIHTYFSNEEIAEIKSVLKIKDASGVPFVLAATIVHNLSLVKKLVKDGYNVNQTGQNNLNALMWAVKYKYLDIVEYLLNNGAEANIKSDCGDNILVLTLENNKIWDEQSTINLWKSVKRVSNIDINFTNKNGHNLLHMCVRKDWEELLQLLLSEKPDLDAGNSNGVTPLMLACFRNNVNIIGILTTAGADILKEDNHGRMSLCYAISATNSNKPPFPAAERIILELRSRSLLGKYLKRRLELIIATAKKLEISCATAEMLIKIVQFIVQFIEETICIFLECDAFTKLAEILEARLENPTIAKFLLEVCEEILFYNEQCVSYKPDLHNKIEESFLKSRLVSVIWKILNRNSEQVRIASNLLALAFKNNTEWLRIFKEYGNTILPLLNDLQTSTEDDSRTAMLKVKKCAIKSSIENLDVATTSLEQSDLRKKGDLSINSKKSRRRSKAIKAKLTKMKSAELSKRINLNGKKSNQTKTKIPLGGSTVIYQKEQRNIHEHSKNPIVTSFQHLLKEETSSEVSSQDVEPKWKSQILKISSDVHNTLQIDQEKLTQCLNHLRKSAANHRFDLNINKSVNVVIDYLKQLVHLIIRKYREHWENDKSSGSCTCLDNTEHVPWFINQHLQAIEAREKQAIQNLQKSFDQLVKSLKDLAQKDLSVCLKSLNNMESLILNYEIRGIKVISYVCQMENFIIKYSTKNPYVDEKTILDNMETVLNENEEPRNDIEVEIMDNIQEGATDVLDSPPSTEIYQREMAQLEPSKQTQEDIEPKMKTIANGFHLIDYTMSVCYEGGEPAHKYSLSDLNRYVLSKCKKNYYDFSEFVPKCLKWQISCLRNDKKCQKLLNGQIRIANKERRLHYIISPGTNLSVVELGLDTIDQPLAVKLILKDKTITSLLKKLIQPLLGIIDTHLLHYFACDYDSNHLVLATPLCRWTLSQYVDQMFENREFTKLTVMQVVKQFLAGLMVLHKCNFPIVHGNLKPTNVFIDFNGIVKLAEFGIYKALYKIKEASTTSLIWFARETLEIYQNSCVMECTLMSDIQVAGMILYYIASRGQHPFGTYDDDIIRNIKLGTSSVKMRILDLRDLILWMTSRDGNERPNIEQIASHTYFWSSSKKWNFILCCAGTDQTGFVLPINIDKLHRSIDIFSNDYLKLMWHSSIRRKFPHARINESDNILGLLKFIKNCVDSRLESNISKEDLCSAIMSMFPSLAVGLFRTLQHTNWLKNAIFAPFSDAFERF